MQHSENSFSPLLIDQQIDHPATLGLHEETRLIHNLHAMYEQDNRTAINRVWTRLSSQQPRQYTLPQRKQGPESLSLPKARDAHAVQRTQESRQANAFVRRLNLLAALLIVVLLVGTLTLVLALLRASTTTGIPLQPTSGWGKMVHIRTMPDAGFNGLAWSPDSTRVAASNRITTTNVVRIWDATTGQHLVTVAVQKFVNTLTWSPNSQQVAIETMQNIIIVDGQNGHVLRTLSVPRRPLTLASSGAVPLSSRFPASSGPELRTPAWSPDGSQIAASFFGDSKERPSVLVWNLQTGGVVRLQVKSYQNFWGGISWSSNGEYIAADTFHTAYTDPLSQSGVVVWKVATQQMILQRDTGSLPDVNVTLAWQPGTLNLAQIGVVKSGNSYATAILILDGTNGTTLKQLVVPVSDVLTWSPDGTYLAYTSPADVEKGNRAQILDASTWRVVYTYKDDQNIINELAWSPNGHFIATGETVIQKQTDIGVVKVWVALDEVQALAFWRDLEERDAV